MQPLLNGGKLGGRMVTLDCRQTLPRVVSFPMTQRRWNVIRVGAKFLRVLCLAACVTSVFACHRDKEQATVLTNVLTAKYHVGETWKYKARPGEEASTFTVVRVESTPKLGVIVHVSLGGLSVHSKHAPTGISDRIAHMPFSEAAIDKSVTAIVGEAESLPEFEEGYREWRTGFDQGKAGVFTIPVAEAVGYIESILKN
jgi:hypothetical protein